MPSKNIENINVEEDVKPVKKVKTTLAKVNADAGLNLRTVKTYESSVKEILPFDTEVTIEGSTNGEWVKVTTSEGKTGFVVAEFLTF